MPPLYAPSPLLAARPARRTRPWAFATLSMLLGVGSVVLALAEPQHDGVSSGFVVSTLGITAIVSGVHAVRRARWGSATSRAFGRGGVILGAVGSALMLYGLIAYAATGFGVALPVLGLPPHHTTTSGIGSVGPPGSGPAVTASAAPRPALPEPAGPTNPPTPSAVPGTSDAVVVQMSAVQERSALEQAAGTLAFSLRQQFGPGPFPSALLCAGTPGRIMLADGTILAPVPDGTRMLYAVGSDGLTWTVTLIGPAHSSVVTYSSAVGVMQAG